MNKTFDFKLITPESIIFEGQANEVILPTQNGQIGVFANHEPLITLLKPGEIFIKNDTETIHLASMGGFVEINNNVVKVLSDSAIRSEEIDAMAAEAAKAKAEQALEKAVDDAEVANASAALEKSLLHLKVVRKKHHH